MRSMWKESTVSMNPTEAIEFALDIGKQLHGKVICPRCRVDSWPDEEQQTLSTYGDFEDTLFCPHCELDLHLRITNL